jgi:hypothetical protein
MTTHNGEREPIRYKVDLSEPVKEWIRVTYRELAEAGKGPALVAAVRKMVDRLQREPFVFGEPSYRLPALKLQVRQGAVHPLIVNYAVHETLPFVFVRSLTLLS